MLKQFKKLHPPTIMHAWPHLRRDWVIMLSTVEGRKVVCQRFFAPPKSALAFESLIVICDFTNTEKTDMHLMYGGTNGKGKVALWLCQERCPSRLIPNHKIFQRLHRQLNENGSFIFSIDGRGRPRTRRQEQLREVILHHVDEIPGTSTRAVACCLHVSQQTIQRVFRLVDTISKAVLTLAIRNHSLNNLVTLHFKYDQARRRFVEWAQNEFAVVPNFHRRILFSDEAHFWLNGYVNKQNCRIWSEANPQVYVETPLYPEKLTVWCAL
ncbi:hypothetical protein TNCV_1763341 [Trichonephila clavipes]|nr:hypothetical protein TNCV_1763341 [Trichonephila clavipes]